MALVVVVVVVVVCAVGDVDCMCWLTTYLDVREPQAKSLAFNGELDVGTWTWICVVHQPKTFWRDRVLLYVNGRFQHEAKLKYPDASSMRAVPTSRFGGCVHSAPRPVSCCCSSHRSLPRLLDTFVACLGHAVCRFEGQLTSAAMFGTALGADDVQALWSVHRSPAHALLAPATSPLLGTVQLSGSLFKKLVVRGSRTGGCTTEPSDACGCGCV